MRNVVASVQSPTRPVAPMSRLLTRVLAPLALLTLVLVAGLWWALPGDPVASLRRHRAALARVERTPARHLGERVERWRMITAAGDTLSGLWRSALPGTDRPWTVILLGGLVAGERAALLVPDHAAGHLLAVDWPWREARRMTWWQVALRLGAMRHAVLRSPAVLALGVEAAARAPEVNPERIALAGVSMGVPPALSALRLTRRPTALVLLHGAGDLRELMRHGLVREGVPGVIASPLAALGSRLIHPLEPSLHAEAAGSRPVLLVNAVADPLLPRSGVHRLHRLFPEADVRWGPGLHRVPDQRIGVAAATRDVLAWLASGP